MMDSRRTGSRGRRLLSDTCVSQTATKSTRATTTNLPDMFGDAIEAEFSGTGNFVWMSKHRFWQPIIIFRPIISHRSRFALKGIDMNLARARARTLTRFSAIRNGFERAYTSQLRPTINGSDNSGQRPIAIQLVPPPSPLANLRKNSIQFNFRT